MSAQDDLQAQVEDAINFLSLNRESLSEPSFSAREPVLDFGTWQNDAYAVFSHFPAHLVLLAGELHIAIELSQYAASEG